MIGRREQSFYREGQTARVVTKTFVGSLEKVCVLGGCFERVYIGCGGFWRKQVPLCQAK